MVMSNFFLLGLKYSFLENLVRKGKTVEFDGIVSLSCFGPEIYFLDRFRPRNPKWSIFLPLYVTFAK